MTQEQLGKLEEMFRQIGENPTDVITPGMARDLLKDHGNDALAEVLTHLDALIGAALVRNLNISIRRHTQQMNNSYREILIGHTITLSWKGLMLTSFDIEAS